MTIEHIQPSEFEQIGQLLARCSYLNLFTHEQTGEWIAMVYIGDTRGTKTGTTQLDAIRNAVEAAEGGVRE